MTKSWSVPFPESETEHDGMPVFWRFQATVEEDGIKIFALQYIEPPRVSWRVFYL